MDNETRDEVRPVWCDYCGQKAYLTPNLPLHHEDGGDWLTEPPEEQ